MARVIIALSLEIVLSFLAIKGIWKRVEILKNISDGLVIFALDIDL